MGDLFSFFFSREEKRNSLFFAMKSDFFSKAAQTLTSKEEIF